MTFPADKFEPLTEEEIDGLELVTQTVIYDADGEKVAYYMDAENAETVIVRALATIRTLQADLAHAVECDRTTKTPWPRAIGYQYVSEPCLRCMNIKAEFDKQKPAKDG